MNRSTPGLPVPHQLPDFTETHVHRVSDAIQPSHPLSSPSPSAPNPSQHQGLFQWLNFRMRWPKYWSFSFSISPSKEIPGLISFRMDWLDLLAVQGTLKIFSNTTVQKHQFFSAQLSSQSSSHIHIVHTKFWEKHFSVCFPWNTSSLQCRLCYMKYFMLSPLWVSKGIFVC